MPSWNFKKCNYAGLTAMYIKTEVAASAERKDASTTNTSPKRVLKLKRPSSEVDMIGETVG